MGDVLKDLTGMTFGRLTVLQRADDYVEPKSKKRHPQWLCRCECKNEKVILGSSLKRGLTKSCGCISKEVASKTHSKRNYFESIENNITKVFFNNCNEYFLCDTDDWNNVCNTTWILDGMGYAYGVIDNRHIRFHRLIMGVDDINYEVDHIDGNTLNNLKSNLRVCIKEENSMNQKISTKNTSGHVGVYWDTSRNKWCATINANKKQIHIGRFENFNDVVEARERAEEKYHKEYATRNSRNGTYNKIPLDKTLKENN